MLAFMENPQIEETMTAETGAYYLQSADGSQLVEFQTKEGFDQVIIRFYKESVDRYVLDSVTRQSIPTARAVFAALKTCGHKNV